MIENSGGVSVEAVKKIQRDWTVTLLKSKIAAKKMQRKEFDSMSFVWRQKFIKFN